MLDKPTKVEIEKMEISDEDILEDDDKEKEFLKKIEDLTDHNNFLN